MQFFWEASASRIAQPHSFRAEASASQIAQPHSCRAGAAEAPSRSPRPPAKYPLLPRHSRSCGTTPRSATTRAQPQLARRAAGSKAAASPGRRSGQTPPQRAPTCGGTRGGRAGLSEPRRCPKQGSGRPVLFRQVLKLCAQRADRLRQVRPARAPRRCLFTRAPPGPRQARLTTFDHFWYVRSPRARRAAQRAAQRAAERQGADRSRA